MATSLKRFSAYSQQCEPCNLLHLNQGQRLRRAEDKCHTVHSIRHSAGQLGPEKFGGLRDVPGNRFFSCHDFGINYSSMPISPLAYGRPILGEYPNSPESCGRLWGVSDFTCLLAHRLSNDWCPQVGQGRAIFARAVPIWRVEGSERRIAPPISVLPPGESVSTLVRHLDRSCEEIRFSPI